MKYYDWDEKKNEAIKNQRDISFEDIVFAIENGGLLDTILNPDQEKYPNQKVFFVKVNNYAYAVPFIEDKNIIYLKTIYPSRKATRIYLGGEK